MSTVVDFDERNGTRSNLSGSFRTGEGILFRLYNGLGLTYELAAKIEKIGQKK